MSQVSVERDEVGNDPTEVRDGEAAVKNEAAKVTAPHPPPSSEVETTPASTASQANTPLQASSSEVTCAGLPPDAAALPGEASHAMTGPASVEGDRGVEAGAEHTASAAEGTQAEGTEAARVGATSSAGYVSEGRLRYAAPVKKTRSWLVVATSCVLASTVAAAVSFAVVSGRTPEATSATVVIEQVDHPSQVAAGTVAEVAAKVLPSVVQLSVTGGDGAAGTGSGFVLTKDGYIVTNNHVAGEAEKILVTFFDGSRAEATLVGASSDYDIAVVKVDPNAITTPSPDDTFTLTPASLGNSSSLNVGDSVVAVGSPLGLAGTVTSGIVSALARPVTVGEGDEATYVSAIQTDAPINPGNSGGPLVDAGGMVVGVNTAIATVSADGSRSGSIGLGFAVPINTAARVAAEIVATGTSSTPIVGVILEAPKEGSGALVSEVVEPSPAAKAGVQAGDLIIAVNGRPVLSPPEAIVAIRDEAPGQVATLTIVRDGEVVDVPVTLASQD